VSGLNAFVYAKPYPVNFKKGFTGSTKCIIVLPNFSHTTNVGQASGQREECQKITTM